MKLNISYHWFYFDTKLCHDTKNMTYSRIIFITANPHLEKLWFVVRGLWLVKKHHDTRLGCGQISLAAFPRGSPYGSPDGAI